MDLAELLRRLAEHPGLVDSLTLAGIIKFIVHASELKDNIILTQPANQNPNDVPLYLSTTVSYYLSVVASISIEQVAQCWLVFRDIVWDSIEVKSWFEDRERIFEEHGWERGISLYSLLHSQ
ncbi:hypothetical protein FOMPIDRAFT_1135327 [Fomitopsis schrenkii]|uniref:Uncharacterized protein n=1 Tax=Fomitopsis schrenkii TaxID=2126942 RepID=S8EWA4_FOMSC|nr:hypothetical protein FOMPIDRAFT_1135327 [Fomitopsis schrenkii]